jgi:amidase
MATFITRLDSAGSGPRLAVKDLIDVKGVPTTAGSRAVERRAQPAVADAPCLAGAVAAGARIVGKTNLHELAMLPIGTNPWFGTPRNPLDPGLIPGGSSSGSAVAVADDEADIALGSDTGGSVRIPAACCGITGLKTTHGRVSLDGVWPLAPSFDTIGPMARDVAGVVAGMQLLEPGFQAAATAPRTVGRLRTGGHPAIEAAVDRALAAAGLEVVELDWAAVAAGADLWTAIYFDELWTADHDIVAADREGVGDDIAAMVEMEPAFAAGVGDARNQLATWRQSLLALFDRVELLALPTIPVFPPRLEDVTPDTLVPLAIELTSHVTPFSAAGVPCTAQPIPADAAALPASLQLVGPPSSEAALLATAQLVESATR